MPFGGVEILSRPQFEITFQDEKTLDQMKGAAAALGERCGCGVMFVGAESIYVRFERKQERGDLSRKGT